MSLDFKEFKTLIRSKGILGRNLHLSEAIKEYRQKKEGSTRIDPTM